jgi:hypothetical protein
LLQIPFIQNLNASELLWIPLGGVTPKATQGFRILAEDIIDYVRQQQKSQNRHYNWKV